jgi:hypothetical protein
MEIKLPNDKLGYYTVGNRKFYGKLDAVLYAQHTLSDINWHFNNEILNAYDWTVEPETSLNELYYKRAKQLREEYDYIIVMASGGADSTNIIYSFLKNGIHLDEVFMGAPLSGLKNFNWDSSDLRSSNLISETKFAQLPLATEIKTNWPNVKVTIHDFFEDMMEYKGDDWMLHGGHWVHATVSRYSFERHAHIKNLAESGKKIAKIFGADKPFLIRNETGEIYNSIIDVSCQVGIQKSTLEEYPNLETVYFYLTPDMPEIMIKQSHVLAKWLHSPENIKVKSTMADLRGGDKWNQNEIRFSLHHRANIPIVYPMLEGRDPFQTFKSFKNFTELAHDSWFFDLHGKTKLAEMIKSDINSVRNMIHPKYINPLSNSLKVNSYPRFIGHETSFLKDTTQLYVPDISEIQNRIFK